MSPPGTDTNDGAARNMEESFDFGLQRVLDGIELYIQSTTSAGRVSGDGR